MKSEKYDDIFWHISEKWKMEHHEYIYQILQWTKNIGDLRE
jgi:hypothetical protein